MFFPNRININSSDKVLEIGPGSTPYFRSDVLLEKKFTENEATAQFGHSEKLVTDKEIVHYDGSIFPFQDKEFDYVICSHVLEHVENIELFLSEIFRVASKGYFEYPLINYEYLYNFDVHVNFLKFTDGVLYYMKKSDSTLDNFTPVQLFFKESLKQGHEKLIVDLLPLFMEGFEWSQPFKVSKTREISELIYREFLIPRSSEDSLSIESSKDLVKKLIKRVIRF
jgi:SAM-dependent methyltransferase